MEEEYDVFGDLDAVCNNNFLANYKKTVSSADNFNENSDEDLENSIDNLLNSNSNRDANEGRAAAAKKSKAKPKTSNCSLSPETPIQLPTRKTRSSSSKGEPNESQPIVEPTQTRRQTRSSNRTATDVNTPVLSIDLDQPQKSAPKGRGRGRKKKSQANDSADAVASIVVDDATTNPIHRLFNNLSNRHQAALRAAESANVDYVDLVSSPVPRIEGVINLDSDTEETPESVGSNTNVSSLDLSFDEENPEMCVKVIWNGKLETFKLRKYQKFSHMFSKIAQREGTAEANLVFNINNKIINSNDTPASVDYKIYQFINGRIMVNKFDSPPVPTVKKRDANKIMLKIQSDQWKRPLQIEVLKTEKFKILYIKCAEELNIPSDNLKLSFDGEALEFDDTPAQLDLEGGEAIDLRIKK